MKPSENNSRLLGSNSTRYCFFSLITLIFWTGIPGLSTSLCYILVDTYDVFSHRGIFQIEESEREVD